MSQKLYTILVTLVDGRTHTLTNVTETKARQIKQSVWIQGIGFPVSGNSMSIEQVSPYRITTVIITKQVAVEK
jgi:hypothetical protein